MSIRAVIFDYGHVLSAPADVVAHQALVEICGLDPATLDLHYWANRYAYDAGILMGESYWRKIAADTGITLTPEEISELIRQDVLMWIGLNHAMVAWAQKVRQAGFFTGILSNICSELVNTMEQQFRWLNNFDHRIWSCRVRLAKPDPAIFRYALTQFCLPAEEILFIDDREDNVVSARKLGYRAIAFQNTYELDFDLEKLGLFDLLAILRSCADCRAEIR